MNCRSVVWRMRQAADRSLAELRDERGSMTLVSSALIVVALTVILPMVWNFGAVYTVRRQSQNSADAAAQAAAESVARELNEQSKNVWGCVPPETPSTIVMRYVGGKVASIANSGVGAGAAADYAAANRGNVTGYTQHLHPRPADGVHAKLVHGVAVPPVHVTAETSAAVRGLIARSMFSVERTSSPSRAGGEAYLDGWREWKTSCPGNPKAVAWHFQFRWKIRLIRSDW